MTVLEDSIEIKQIMNETIVDNYKFGKDDYVAPAGYTFNGEITKDMTGLSGLVVGKYTNSSGQIVYSVRGTEFPNKDDLSNDFQMAVHKIPDQAEAFMKLVIDDLQASGKTTSDIARIEGHSLGGSIVELAGMTDKFSNVECVTAEAYGVEHLRSKWAETGQQMENPDHQFGISADNSNIHNFFVKDDAIAASREHAGNSYIAEGNYSNPHGVDNFVAVSGASFVQNNDFVSITEEYGEVLGSFITFAGLLEDQAEGVITGYIPTDLDNKIWNGTEVALSLPLNIIDELVDRSFEFVQKILENKVSDLINNFTMSEDSSEITLQFNSEVNESLIEISELKEFFELVAKDNAIRTCKVQTLTEIYTIHQGDTVWDIAQEYGMSVQDILDANPWLEAAFRVNEDKSFILIKPGEKLIVDSNIFDNSLESIDPAQNSLWLPIPAWVEAEGTPQRPGPIDPLILDLDGDGIETVSVTEGKYFDHNLDNFAENTGWVDTDDGVLALDRNSDGVINNATELFGDKTPLSGGGTATTGYQALADLDTNTDGVIDINDDEFANLKVLKGDGSIMTMDEAGIKSFDLAFTNTNVSDGNGNTQLRLGSYTKTDDSVMTMADYGLDSRVVYSQELEILPVSEAIQALPDIQGYGTLHSLHQAMVRDASLQESVESYVNETNFDTRIEIIPEIIYKWTGVENVDPTSRGAFVDAKQLGALEAFMGESYNGTGGANPIEEAADLLKGAYMDLYNFVYSELLIFTIKPLLDLNYVVWDPETQETTLVQDDVIAEIQNQITIDPAAGEALLWEYLQVIDHLGLKDSIDLQQYSDAFSNIVTDFIDPFNAKNKVLVEGTLLDDSLSGSACDEAILGLSGDDYIHARRGDDYVEGGIGNDTILSCFGDDLVYGGDDDDSILAGNIETIDRDTVYGGEGNDYIDAENGDDLIYGDSGNDTLYGKNGNDSLYGGDDNDIIYDGDGEDFIHGGDDNDIIYDGEGQDYIIGGTGNDYIQSNNSDANTFVFRHGDGQDTISGQKSSDTIIFEGINSDEVTAYGRLWTESFSGISGASTVYHTDLYFDFVNSDNEIKIQEVEHKVIGYRNYNEHYEYSYGNHIENIVFDDMTLTYSDLLNRLEAVGTDGNDTISTSDYNELIRGLGGDDNLSASGGDDTVYGGAGSDYINSGNGNNLVYGGIGDDNIYGGSGNNLLYGEEDNDYISSSDGDDTLIGGIGNDSLCAGDGNDTYLFVQGDGDDTISESGQTAVSNDTVVLQGRNSNVARFSAVTNNNNTDFFINFTDSDDVITLRNQHDPNHRVENYAFEDITLTFGNVVSQLETHGTDIAESLYTSNYSEVVRGFAGNDNISSYGGNDTVYGGAGDDNIYGSSGNNLLLGEENDDYINGGNDNDTLVGGTENDNLNGRLGDDTYIFAQGDGDDTISDYNPTATSNDTVVLQGRNSNVARFSAVTTNNNTDFFINFTDSDDVITLKNQNNFYYRIENYVFDNETLTYSDVVNRLETHGTDIAESLYTSNYSEVVRGFAGNDYINSRDGNDTVYGGTGADSMIGGDGNDIYIVDNTGDVVTETNSDSLIGGVDEIQTTLTSFDLSTNGANIENLTYTGSSDATLTGNDENNVITGSTGNDNLYGLAGNDSLIGGTGSDSIIGGEGNDTIMETTGLDTIYGGDGEDRIIVGNETSTSKFVSGSKYIDAGDDNDYIFANTSMAECTIIGGLGDDTIKTLYGHNIMEGGEGNDTFIVENSAQNIYIFNLNDGQDTITDIAYYTAIDRTDTIQFGTGILRDNLKIEKSDNDLILSFTNSSDKITILGHFESDNVNRIEQVYFEEDDITLTSTDIESLITNFYGTDDGDEIAGNNIDNAIYGLSGNDTIIGGLGNDCLYGGDGADTYIFNLGDGIDTITDLQGIDKIQFNGDITQADLIFIKENNDLEIVYREIPPGMFSPFRTILDAVIIKDWFINTDNRIESIEFENDTAISGAETIESLITSFYGTDDGDEITGNNLDNAIFGLSGNDTIIGGLGNDYLGSDYLRSDGGADTYIFNIGDGQDTIKDSEYTSGVIDTIQFESDVVKNDVAMFMNGYGDLIIGYGSSDQITVRNQSNSDYGIENVILDSGEYLTDSDINQVIQDMTTYAVNNGISMTSVEDIKNNTELMNIFTSSWNAA